jgi:hypothetical protein
MGSRAVAHPGRLPLRRRDCIVVRPRHPARRTAITPRRVASPGGPMASSRATTPEEYLSELPADRRTVLAKVRDVIKRNLPRGYRESMNWGMLCYNIPLEDYPDTYNGQPLGYVCLAAQKNYFSLYLTALYQDRKQEAWLKEEFRKAGKKLDMGKSCVRFKSLDDLPLDVIGKAVASTPPDAFIAQYEAIRKART